MCVEVTSIMVSWLHVAVLHVVCMCKLVPAMLFV